jgi:hypothetical protein
MTFLHWAARWLPLGFLLCCACQAAPGSCSNGSCAPSPTATAQATSTHSPTAAPVFTSSPAPSQTPTLFPTSSTPLAAPAIYQTKRLMQGVKPREYVADTCAYLRTRWDPARSAPGTVAVPVMFHGIDRGDFSTPLDEFKSVIYFAQRFGYQTITMRQFADFMVKNAAIPPRAMVWIIDDRLAGTVEQYFISPEYTPASWTFSSAWDIATTDDALWKRVKAMHDTGRVEIQAHGYLHNYPLVDAWLNSPPFAMTTDAFLRHEIIEPIGIIKEKVGDPPTAYVWPGGGFSKRAVDMVRQAGYPVGFTSNARGPLMFNWVPLSAEEAAVNDPLLVLPRHWGAPGLVHQLAESALMGNEASAFARKNYPAEADYYRGMCGGELPPLPAQPTELPPLPTAGK